MKQRFLSWIRLKLGILFLEARCDTYEKQIRNLKADLLKNEDELTLLRNTLKVGVDYHEHISQSWAIVCVAGQTEYIKLFTFPQKDARVIRDFLKAFEYRNVVIDKGPHTPKEIFFR